MSIMRSLLLAVLLIALTPLQAAFDQSPCAELERWSAGFDQRARVKVAPQIEMPSLLQDESLSSLFGKPILGWGKQQFRDVDEHLNRCRQQAAQRGNREAAAALKAVRAEIDRVADLARDYRQALHKVEKAVQQLDTQPPSAELAQAVGLAIDALNRKDIRRKAGGLPPELQRSLQAVMNGADYLSDKAASRFAGHLQKLQAEVDRKAQQQAAKAKAFRPESELTPEERGAEHARARQVLREAQARIDSAGADNEGLILLEGMLELPELLRVPTQEKQAFLDRVYARHDDLSLRIRQAREEESQRLARQRLEKLYGMSAAKLGDLGKLLAYREGVHQSLRQSGQRQAAQAFEDGFQPYFEQQAGRLLPEFKAALDAIPGDAAGLAKLDRAVAVLIGFPDHTSYLDSYYALAERRREAIRKGIAR